MIISASWIKKYGYNDSDLKYQFNQNYALFLTSLISGIKRLKNSLYLKEKGLLSWPAG